MNYRMTELQSERMNWEMIIIDWTIESQNEWMNERVNANSCMF